MFPLLLAALVIGGGYFLMSSQGEGKAAPTPSSDPLKQADADFAEGMRALWNPSVEMVEFRDTVLDPKSKFDSTTMQMWEEGWAKNDPWIAELTGLTIHALTPSANEKPAYKPLRAVFFKLGNAAYTKAKTLPGKQPVDRMEKVVFGPEALTENIPWLNAANTFVKEAVAVTGKPGDDPRGVTTEMTAWWFSDDPKKHIEAATTTRMMAKSLASKPEAADFIKAANALVELEKKRAKRLGATAADLASIDAPSGWSTENPV
jgi:hypothetical protein